MKGNTKETSFGKAVAVVAIVVILLVIFTYIMLNHYNEKNAEKTGQVMLNQMIGVLEKNESAEETLLESLKEEYIIRAKAIAYILEYNTEAENDIEELSKIATLMSIDEIHLINEEGVIYAGTRPEYYGFSFDSGDQIRYFKPMLDNKELSMCQDVTPNTAEGKEMMYAITWDSTGTRMIQVGIEPIRLLKELNNNSITNVIDQMPVYENLKVYVADTKTKEILGATDYQTGMKLQDIGIDVSELPSNVVNYYVANVNDHSSDCSVLIDVKYIICIVQDREVMRKDVLFAMLIVVVYLSIAAVLILVVFRHLYRIRKEQMEQLTILTSVSEIYYSMHLIDLENNTIKGYSSPKRIEQIVEKRGNGDAEATVHEIMHATMSDEYLEQGLEFSELSTLADRLKGKKILSMDLLGKNVGWIRMSFITIGVDLEERPKKVICTTQIIDEEKRKEAYLIRQSTTDKLTQCYNRRAYEQDARAYNKLPKDEDFAVFSMDVNGLKNVNDTLGHAAGDELLIGATKCMKQCFGKLGKVYRMGGDEFIAIVIADSDILKEMKEDLEKAFRKWSGEIVHSLTVSCGCVTKKEFPNSTIAEMAKIADHRMYQEKERYYEEIGCNRRKSES